ncbi:MAG: hypothetical protein HKN87_13580 [Saprospiraceae bacterium]|nr:hypothetical protein [Saprospiraceae bacterium]
MAKAYLFTLLGLVLMTTSIDASISDNLANHISAMQEGDHLSVRYTFEGCFGRYHDGLIEMEMIEGSIRYKNHSYADKKAEAFTQSGSFPKAILISRLKSASQLNSRTIYGNQINYEINATGQEPLRGTDRIEQRNFIKIFHPFSSFQQDQDQMIIPGLSTGGFVK